jgi:predicted RNase H-like HicB family nuclease
VNDIVFQVAEDEDGTYCASWDDPRGGGISTQGSDLAELQAMVRDAVLCHFDEGEVPERVRLHFAQDPALAAGDPCGFIGSLPGPVIIDEIQKSADL